MRPWLAVTMAGRNRHKLIHPSSVSGGGGWGKKQGLLSLDPETRFAPPEGEDVDMLMRSLASQGHADSLHGIVSPGSWIQFLVAPGDCPEQSGPDSTPQPIVFGTSSHTEPEASTGPETSETFDFSPGFGGLSTRGIFIESTQGGTQLYSRLNIPYSRAVLR